MRLALAARSATMTHVVIIALLLLISSPAPSLSRRRVPEFIRGRGEEEDGDGNVDVDDELRRRRRRIRDGRPPRRREEEERRARRGEGDLRGKGAAGEASDVRRPLRRLEEESRAVESNRREWKRRHMEIHGRELTDSDIDAAIQRARDNGPGRWDEGYKRRLVKRIPGLEEYHEPPSDLSRRAQATNPVTNLDGILISGLSPGWPWNLGRNEFYCLSIKDIRKDYLPKRGERLNLSDCYTTPEEMIALRVTADREIIFDALDGIYWDWCSEGKNPRKGAIVTDHCDLEDVMQVWNLLRSDNTWRPDVDPSRCVTAKPPQAGSRGGGRLKLKKCTSRAKQRQAQVFIFCRELSDCEFNDEGFLDCVIEDECSDG